MSKDTTISPFFYPTKVILVDDDTRFMKHFGLMLDKDFIRQPFSQPVKAVDYINKVYPTSESLKSSIIVNDHIKCAWHNGCTIDVTTDGIHHEIYNHGRFEEVSVIIVDYVMPDLNGIEFCKKIKNKNIKKILLTGQADEKLAVQAFNDDLVDYFVRKDDDDIHAKINDIIYGLQQKYFKDVSKSVLPVLEREQLNLLRIPNFVDYFRKIVKKHRIVEYYLLEKPFGFLLLNSKGETFIMLIATSELLDAHVDIASDQRANQDLINHIKSRKQIPYFKTKDGFYDANKVFDWKKCLYPAQVIGDEKDYVFSTLIDFKPNSHQDKKKVISLHDFRKMLEENVGVH